ncbi:2-hydroxyacid dehydrogenase [Mangrovicoccus algicola]|uniref:2-hydroxyacid dehydrogenase n=1 Tax=Mangrovicoccus algicola TaxID=2771008 RepID=A0A8J7CV77_9RHOB|nr:2-hydroxyacid dehydrogenase [Mangrovicoccus algicola]MBE3638429.1 2-hydroxyacid dehydrogenase [Mangrovicoccus algicola]
MSDTVLLICGPFTPEERGRLEGAHAALHIGGPDEIAALPEAARATIRAVAYKGHHPFGETQLAALPALGIVANYGVGYDAIDVAAASARGVKVTNTPDVLNDDVADLAVGMMLAFSRRLEDGAVLVRSGDWAQRALPLNRKFSGGRVGIVGLGRIGREIADRLAAFKMEIHYTSRSRKDTPGWTWHADPVALAAEVDWLVIALVGGPETQNHVGAEALAALGSEGVVVNISRGTTVDEAALLEALEQGTIRGAALDVFLNEPDIDPRFRSLDNAVLQPHQGSGTVETRRAMLGLQLDNITAFLAGRALLTAVN